MNENIFGKQPKSSFDEMLARRDVASLPEKTRASFMAMTPEQRLEFIELVNEVIRPTGHSLVLT